MEFLLRGPKFDIRTCFLRAGTTNQNLFLTCKHDEPEPDFKQAVNSNTIVSHPRLLFHMDTDKMNRKREFHIIDNKPDERKGER